MAIDQRKVGQRIKQAIDDSAKFDSFVSVALELKRKGMKGGDERGASVSRWVGGKHIRLETLNDLSRILNRRAMWFLEGTED